MRVPSPTGGPLDKLTMRLRGPDAAVQSAAPIQSLLARSPKSSGYPLFGYWLSGVRAQGCGALDEFTKVEGKMAECVSLILPSGWSARSDWYVVLEVDALGDVIGR